MNPVLSYIEAGHSDGANLVAGGKRILEETGGTYVEPTIFDGVSNAMKIAQEEIFGPVLSVIAFDTAEEAIQIANDTPYGLAAAVWTKDISKAHLTAKALRAGSVWVNQSDGGDDRKSVESGKSVSVRVDLGGRRIFKKKKKDTTSIHRIRIQN